MGYARLLDVPVSVFSQPGFTLVETTQRNEPEWAGWVLPIWLFALGRTVVCSVSPSLAACAHEVLMTDAPSHLLTSAALTQAQRITNRWEWVQCELFYYPHEEPPRVATEHAIKALQPGDPEADRRLRTFDGGVLAIRDQMGQILSAAYIKNKGVLQEIAVGTSSDYRRQGLGKAVVAEAVQTILRNEKVPVYWPDSRENQASYALVQSLGFVKVAEMLFCCYEQPDWQGFPLPEN